MGHGAGVHPSLASHKLRLSTFSFFEAGEFIVGVLFSCGSLRAKFTVVAAAACALSQAGSAAAGSSRARFARGLLSSMVAAFAGGTVCAAGGGSATGSVTFFDSYVFLSSALRWRGSHSMLSLRPGRACKNAPVDGDRSPTEKPPVEQLHRLLRVRSTRVRHKSEPAMLPVGFQRHMHLPHEPGAEELVAECALCVGGLSCVKGCVELSVVA